MTSQLFEPLAIGGLTVRNRIFLAPMCQYSAHDGVIGDWHLQHLGARAAGGFGLLLAEATAVVPEGRISPECAGLWDPDHVDAWRRVTKLSHEIGTPIGVQLAHAGRKASVYAPWRGQGSVPDGEGGWPTSAPSAIAMPGLAVPEELTAEGIAGVVQAFADAASRAHDAGFDAVQIHGAHGYLIHQFLSPLANHRADEYGGSAANRFRLLGEVIAAVRAAFPEPKPVLLRLSATDGLDGGLSIEDTCDIAARAAAAGAAMIDVTSYGLMPVQADVGPGYLVPFARAVKEAAGIPVSAVGFITEASQAETILRAGSADAVSIGRAALRDPMWPRRAAHELRIPADALPWPQQYELAAWR